MKKTIASQIIDAFFNFVAGATAAVTSKTVLQPFDKFVLIRNDPTVTPRLPGNAVLGIREMMRRFTLQEIFKGNADGLVYEVMKRGSKLLWLGWVQELLGVKTDDPLGLLCLKNGLSGCAAGVLNSFPSVYFEARFMIKGSVPEGVPIKFPNFRVGILPSLRCALPHEVGANGTIFLIKPIIHRLLWGPDPKQAPFSSVLQNAISGGVAMSTGVAGMHPAYMTRIIMTQSKFASKQTNVPAGLNTPAAAWRYLQQNQNMTVGKAMLQGLERGGIRYGLVIGPVMFGCLEYAQSVRFKVLGP